MAFIDDFADMLNQDITVKSAASLDDYGKITYGSAVAYKARVIYKNKLIRNNLGEEVVARGMVWIKGSPDIENSAQITLPDSSVPVNQISVERFTDEVGETHTKVYF